MPYPVFRISSTIKATSSALLSAARCQLLVARCLLPAARCQLSTVNCQLHVARCLLPVACCLLLLASCSGSVDRGTAPPPAASYRYAPGAVMTSTRVNATAKAFNVALPKGWKETADPENAPSIVLWLVRDDYAASISFTAFAMDPALYVKLRRDGLPAIARVSLSLRKQRARDTVTVIQQPETFTQGGRTFAAYEYSVDGGKTVIRVVVFDSGSRFYECTLMPSAGMADAAEIRRMMEVQQSVLATLETR